LAQLGDYAWGVVPGWTWTNDSFRRRAADRPLAGSAEVASKLRLIAQG